MNENKRQSLTEEQAKFLTGTLDGLVSKIRKGEIDMVELVKQYEKARISALGSVDREKK